MAGIPANLLQRLKTTLLRCGPFDDDGSLRAIFADARINPWRDTLPHAASPADRVQRTIDHLSDQYNSQGENVLILFLRALCEHTSVDDIHHQELATLGDELEQCAPTPDTPQWDAALDRYREWVKRTYGTMRVLGKPEPVSVEGIYTDVYLLSRPQAWHRHELIRLSETSNRPGGLERRIDGSTMIQEPGNQRLVILGKPGAGKTTFLKHIALQAAERKLGNKVPVFLALRDWATTEILAFIAEEFSLCGLPNARSLLDQLLDAGQIILLFDGLDEVNETGGRRAELISALERFCKSCTAQVLVTCRNAATEYQFEQFKYVEVANFTEEQVAAYATNWFKDIPATYDNFCIEIKRDKHLHELARTPLLLGMLCLTYEELGAFPKRRADLYREALDVLLRHWDKSRNIQRDEVYHNLLLSRKKQMFSAIGYRTFNSGEYFVTQEKLEALVTDYLVTLPNAVNPLWIDAEVVLKAIETQHGILTERARRVYSFAHSTFQEYFAAYHIAYRVNSGDTDILLCLMLHIHEDHWREVVMLTASMLDSTNTFFQYFLDALDTHIHDDEKLKAFLAWVTQKNTSGSAPHQPTAIRAYYAWLELDTTFACVRILDRTLARARDYAYAIVRDLGYTATHSVKLDRTLANALISAYNPCFDLDSPIDMETPCAQAEELQFSPLSRSLAALTPPDDDIDPDWAWGAALRKVFAERLRFIMLEHRDIARRWDFDEGQVEKLNHYFTAAHLLVGCLNVANISSADRAAIEDRLLLPPEHETGSV